MSIDYQTVLSDFGLNVPTTWNREPEDGIDYSQSDDTVEILFTARDYDAAAAWALANCSTSAAVSAAGKKSCSIRRQGGLAEIRLRLTYQTGNTGGSGESNGNISVNGKTYEIVPQQVIRPLATAPRYVAKMVLTGTFTKRTGTTDLDQWLNAQLLPDGASSREFSLGEVAKFGEGLTPGERAMLVTALPNYASVLKDYWSRIDRAQDSWSTEVPVLTRVTRKSTISGSDYHGSATSTVTTVAGFPGVPSGYKYLEQASRVTYDPANRQCIVTETWIGMHDFDSDLFVPL